MTTSEDSTLRVLKDNVVVGAAFAVTNQLIATCAHVVQSAGGKPGDTIWVGLKDGTKVEAFVEPRYWKDPSKEDIAILRLENPHEKIKPVILGSSKSTKGHTFSTSGFPTLIEELTGRGEIIGQATVKGINVLQLRSPEVTPGFSGAPITDEITNRVIGMALAITPPDNYARLGTTAFAVPAETLNAICPELKLQTINPNASKWLIGVMSILVVAIGIIWLAFSLRYDTSPMKGEINVAVARFVEKPDSECNDNNFGLRVAEQFYSKLQNDVNQGDFYNSTGLNMELREPNTLPVLFGKTEQDIEKSAETLSEKINSHIVIYGTYSCSQISSTTAVDVKFYVSPNNFSDAQEILGELSIGTFHLNGVINSGSDLVGQNKQLRDRLEVISLVMKTLGAYIGEDFESANKYITLALSDEYWKDNLSGKEALYIIAGNISIRQARFVLTNAGLEASFETIQQAENYFQKALEAATEKGSYSRAYLGLAGVETFKSNAATQLSHKTSDINTSALERAETYLQLASKAEFKPISSDVIEKVHYNEAQIALTYYLVTQKENLLENAKTHYRAVINSYEHGNLRVSELAALSHSGLAVVDGIQKNYTAALTEYQKTLNITKVPTLKALTLIHIGDTYFLLSDKQNALKYYQEALYYEGLLQKRIGVEKMELLKQKITELQ